MAPERREYVRLASHFKSMCNTLQLLPRSLSDDQNNNYAFSDPSSSRNQLVYTDMTTMTVRPSTSTYDYSSYLPYQREQYEPVHVEYGISHQLNYPRPVRRRTNIPETITSGCGTKRHNESSIYYESSNKKMAQKVSEIPLPDADESMLVPNRNEVYDLATFSIADGAVPLSTISESEPISTAMEAALLSTAIEPVPLSTTTEAICTSTPMEPVPLSTSMEPVSLSTAVEPDSLSTTLEPVTFSTGMEAHPLATTMVVPTSTDMEQITFSIAMEAVPLSTAMETIPLSTAVEVVRLSTAVDADPLNAAMEGVPYSADVVEAPQYSVEPGEPLSTIGMALPMSTTTEAVSENVFIVEGPVNNDDVSVQGNENQNIEVGIIPQEQNLEAADDQGKIEIKDSS